MSANDWNSVLDHIFSLADEEDGGRDVVANLAGGAIKHLRPSKSWVDLPTSTQMALRILRHVREIAGHGVMWKGRPLWMTDEILLTLKEEADCFKDTANLFPGGHHSWIRGGARLTEFAESEAVHMFAEEHFGKKLGKAQTTYFFYEDEGKEAYPHIDTAEFGMNLICLLSHEYLDSPTSGLWVYPIDSDPIHVELQVGEVVVLFSGSTVHQRTPVGANERVRVMSIAWPDDSYERKIT